jgi:FAD/FMN-containing dehydrogenase
MQRRTSILIVALLILSVVALLRDEPGGITSPSHLLVNDVTGMNPIQVGEVLEVESIPQLQRAVQQHAGPVSIGGGRYSMGGQIASDGSLHLDMRRLNRIIALDTVERTITVEAGTTWRKIQEAVDPYDLSVKVMQSYSNFTVGGSLSVNAHGRYTGTGPLIHSVRSLKVVLADGSLREIGPTHDPEIFYGVIGGYGSLGVIVEATLDLVQNVKLERHWEMVPVERYVRFFDETIRGRSDVVLHNGDLLQPDYSSVSAISYRASERDVTEPSRLSRVTSPSPLEQVFKFVLLDLPFTGRLRGLIERVRHRDDVVVWRNFEAGYDVGTLGQFSSTDRSYVLQEYFVPPRRFDRFRSRVAEVLLRDNVEVLNVSIRHATADPGSFLAWAPEEVFGFVICYRQYTDPDSRAHVGLWTRELIDAAIDEGGSYFLPYQLHATPEQFHRAYPRARDLFALKDRLDPAYKFRNRLIERYYRRRNVQADASR